MKNRLTLRQVIERKKFSFRYPLWDESAKVFSADIIIKIENEDGQFIRVLKAVTPVK